MHPPKREQARRARLTKAIFDHMRAAADAGLSHVDFTAMRRTLRLSTKTLSVHLGTLTRFDQLSIASCKRRYKGGYYIARRITFRDGKVIESASPGTADEPPIEKTRVALLAYLRGLADRGEHLPDMHQLAADLSISRKRLATSIGVLQRNGDLQSSWRKLGGTANRYTERRYTFPDGATVVSAPVTLPPRKTRQKAATDAVEDTDGGHQLHSAARGMNTLALKYNGVNLPDSAVYTYKDARNIRALRQYGDDAALPATYGHADMPGWLLINGRLNSPEMVDERVARALRSLGLVKPETPPMADLINRY